MEDWVRIRSNLPSDFKVGAIARLLVDPNSALSAHVTIQGNAVVTDAVTRRLVAGAVSEVWGNARHRGKIVGDDLFLPGAYLELIDGITHIPGFGEAMKSVGWVVASKKGLTFPNFFAAYNSPADEPKRPMTNAERQQKYRESRKGDPVTKVTKRNAREEESREEMKSLPLPLPLPEDRSGQSLKRIAGLSPPFDTVTTETLRDAAKLRAWFLDSATAIGLSTGDAAWETCCAAACKASTDGRVPPKLFQKLMKDKKGRDLLTEADKILGRQFAKGLAA